MTAFPPVARRSCLLLGLLMTAAGLLAQTPTPPTPRLGQPGKDVLWLPSPQAMVDGMLDMAKVTRQDLVMDLGSGDGRLVIAAAKRGARAVGVEYNADLIDLSKKNAATQGVSDKATFIRADLFETDLSKATVITMFLRDDLNFRLRPRLLDLMPGTRIVSNTFTMGDWEPDDTVAVERDCASWCFAMLWIVPAKVEGTWRLPQGDMTLGQTFQMVTGTLRTRSGSVSLADSRLRGDQITFRAGNARYVGRVSGRTIEGTITAGGSTVKWSATRVGTVPGRDRP
jgi:SAM-dependent methyltransferase